MTTKERYRRVVEYFSEHMPSAESELNFENPYQLLVAVILSAQCTDKRVNMTTPALFEAYPTATAMAEASAEDTEAVGLTIGEYSKGKISIKTTKVGTATITVKMLVGGGSLADKTKPFPTEVTRKFVVISKEKVASNGGWL